MQKNNMTELETSRWMALICAIDVIDKQCQLKKINFEKVNIKPSSVKKFIEEKAREIQFNYMTNIEAKLINQLSQMKSIEETINT